MKSSKAFGRITFCYRKFCNATLNRNNTPAGLFQTLKRCYSGCHQFDSVYTVMQIHFQMVAAKTKRNLFMTTAIAASTDIFFPQYQNCAEDPASVCWPPSPQSTVDEYVLDCRLASSFSANSHCNSNTCSSFKPLQL